MAFSERLRIIFDAVTGKAISDIRGIGDGIEDVDKKVDKTTKSSSTNFGKFAKGAAAAFAVKQVADFAGAIVDAGTVLESMDAKAETVFGGQIGRVKAWADANAAAMGVTQTEAIAAGAAIADLLKPMGFTEEAATDQSLALLDLSAALAAWSGGKRDAAEVSEILAKAMLGEREQLKTLGISITEAEVKARLLANGTDKLTGAQLQQAKATATQQLIMEKSTDAQKAWADGSMDAAKTANESKAAMAELQETLTRALLPAMQAIVPAVAEVVTAIGPLIEVVGEVAEVVGTVTEAVSSVDWSKPFAGGGELEAFRDKMVQIDETAASLGLTTAELSQKVLDGSIVLDDMGRIVSGVNVQLVAMDDSNKEAAQSSYNLGVEQDRLAAVANAAADALKREDEAMRQLKDAISTEEEILGFTDAMSAMADEIDRTKTLSDETRLKIETMALGLDNISAARGAQFKIALDTGDIERAVILAEQLKSLAALPFDITLRANFVADASVRNLMEDRGSNWRVS